VNFRKQTSGRSVYELTPVHSAHRSDPVLAPTLTLASIRLQASSPFAVGLSMAAIAPTAGRFCLAASRRFTIAPDVNRDPCLNDCVYPAVTTLLAGARRRVLVTARVRKHGRPHRQIIIVAQVPWIFSPAIDLVAGLQRCPQICAPLGEPPDALIGVDE
jgi:hypothetical protein